jgi:hypothetical protein
MVAATVFNLAVKGPNKPEPYRFGLEKCRAWRLTFEREPLLQRGWTVQERLLAPHVVHFGRKQVFWECHGTSCCEVHQRIVVAWGSPFGSSLTAAGRQVHAWKHLLSSADRYNANDGLRQLLDDWYGVQGLYSTCQLTVPGDKAGSAIRHSCRHEAAADQARLQVDRILCRPLAAGDAAVSIMECLRVQQGQGEEAASLPGSFLVVGCGRREGVVAPGTRVNRRLRHYHCLSCYSGDNA